MEPLEGIYRAWLPIESGIKSPHQTQQNLVLIGYQSVIRSFKKPTA
jgi:hypothetical protein